MIGWTLRGNIQATTGDAVVRSDVSSPVVVVTVAAVALVSVLLVAVNGSLVGDGSLYLLKAVQLGQPFPLPGRQVLNAVREGPLLLGLTSGITNMHLLTVLEGVGFVLLPALAWTYALVRARRSRLQFMVVSVSCALCFAPMILFSVSELTLALPLVVLASVLLTSATPWSGPDSFLVVLATGLLILSHQSIVPCAVLLTIQALLRMRARLSVQDSRVSAVVAVLATGAAVAAVWTIVYRPNSNSTAFLANVEDVRHSSMALLMVGAAFLVGWAALFGRVHYGPWIRWVLLAPAAYFTVVGIGAAIHGGPEAAYASRGFCVIVVVAAQVALFADWFRLRRPHAIGATYRWSMGAAWGACVFCVAVMIIPTVCALRWSAVMGQFRTTITHHTGTVSADAVESPLAASYLWPWTNPLLSLAVRSSADDAVVANSAPFASITVQSAGIVVPPAYRWGK